MAVTADAASPDPAGPVCPAPVRRPVMSQRWARLTFLHWAYDPGAVQRLLPAGLRVHELDGAAWVGLVPFFMHVGTAGGRRAPWVSTFCETNVRTYVRDEAGRTGIWFLSLEAARLGAVTVARAAYGLPYYWSAMRIGERSGPRGTELAYYSRRRWPGPAGVTSRIAVRVGEPVPPAELTARDHFLTARWTLFSVTGSGTGSRRRLARASHQPWPLHAAEVLVLDDELMTAAGLPAPQGAPLAWYSPGVDVAIGRPERGG